MSDHDSQTVETSPISPVIENGSSDVAVVVRPAQRLWVTVEPALFCVTVAASLCGSVYTQLLLERSCEVVFRLGEVNCSLLVNKTSSKEAHAVEDTVQPHVTKLQMYKSIIEACVPIVLCLFVGAWSDVHGRKPLIMWPLFGYAIHYGMVAIISMIPDLSPTYILLASLPIAFSGGLMTIINGVYAYISDVSTPERRAFSGSTRPSLKGAIISVFGAVVGPLCRSILSKCVPHEDVGAVFALTSLVEAVTPLAASPLYNFVYNATLLCFPGAFLLLSSSLYLLDIIIVSVVVILQHTSAPSGYSQMQVQE
ncbi:hypothetical protein C0J52_10904 [Blattella germanica]|nr:hypothetical protein C0J52_10904 [Blattella germanica]